MRCISLRTFRARSRTVAGATSPAVTAATSLAPRSRAGPGISRSSPAFTVGAVEREPNQSDITAPSKPHSSRSTSVSSQRCSAV